MTSQLQNAVETIWNYMQMHQHIKPADALILLGSRDDRVASCAAGLLQRNLAPICVVTGGLAHQHDFLATKWSEGTEADHFIAMLRAEGIDEKLIYREAEATNTGENALFSYRLLSEHQIQPKSILIVTKPYMERRALATFEAQWPDKTTRMQVTSVGGMINEYCNDTQPFETTVHIMVGDFQRIMEYVKHGFLSQQPMPANVVEAYHVLVAAGYTKHLLVES